MMRISSKLRLGLAGFAVSAAALLGLEHLAAQGMGGGIAGHDSNAPVNYAADRIELMDKQGQVVLSGNVEITQGDLVLRAPRTTVTYSNQGELKIQRLDATGGVSVVRGAENLRGDVAIYDFGGRIITLLGHVTMARGNDAAQHSARLVIDLAKGHTVTDGGTGGRVSGSFSVAKAK
jgi:lipopolysaccharide export system protein LptA